MKNIRVSYIVFLCIVVFLLIVVCILKIIYKAIKFRLTINTIIGSKDEFLTSTGDATIKVDWSVQIRPKRDENKLITCIRALRQKENDSLYLDCRLIIIGAFSDTIASMSSDKIFSNRKMFKKDVETNVSNIISKMGLELVSFNIIKVYK